MKIIIKETFIMLLLCATIALILAVMFYDYIPINKVVPEPVAYSMPAELSDVKEELSNTFSENKQNIVLTYEITEQDLAGYKQTSEYVPGKANPFQAYSEEPTENNKSDDSSSNAASSSTTTTQTKNTNSTGTLFETGNTK